MRQPIRSPRASIARAAVAALGAVALPAVIAISCDRSSAPGAVSFDGPTAVWASYGGDPGGMRYSLLTQIDRSNVARLEEAWTFHTREPLGDRPFAFEVTPILVGERLVVCTPWNRVIALDPETGAELWRFDPELDPSVYYANQFVCRGVSAWRDSDAPADAVCRDRLFMGTNDGRLMAIDAATGARCDDFGQHGEVDLKIGVGEIARPGDYQVTSPPAIARGLVITGSAVNDNQSTDAPSGVVRAYDARTGALRWAWDATAPPIETTSERAPAADIVASADTEVTDGDVSENGGPAPASTAASRPRRSRPRSRRAVRGRRAPPTCGP